MSQVNNGGYRVLLPDSGYSGAWSARFMSLIKTAFEGDFLG